MASRQELPPSRFVDLDGPVHYREWRGPDDITFVYVHGLGETHLTWITVAPSLAANGRVLVLDLPGFGLSPRFSRSATLPSCRTILSALPGAWLELPTGYAKQDDRRSDEANPKSDSGSRIGARGCRTDSWRDQAWLAVSGEPTAESSKIIHRVIYCTGISTASRAPADIRGRESTHAVSRLLAFR
jgi:pimeloyl-ACP methyl ester carboxylesterase